MAVSRYVITCHFCVQHGCRNPGRLNLCTVALNIGELWVWNLIQVSLLAPTTSRCLLDVQYLILHVCRILVKSEVFWITYKLNPVIVQILQFVGHSWHLPETVLQITMVAARYFHGWYVTLLNRNVANLIVCSRFPREGYGFFMSSTPAMPLGPTQPPVYLVIYVTSRW